MNVENHGTNYFTENQLLPSVLNASEGFSMRVLKEKTCLSFDKFVFRKLRSSCKLLVWAISIKAVKKLTGYRTNGHRTNVLFCVNDKKKCDALIANQLQHYT